MLNVFKKIGIISLGLLFSFNLAFAQGVPNVVFSSQPVFDLFNNGGQINGTIAGNINFANLNPAFIDELFVATALLDSPVDPDSYDGGYNGPTFWSSSNPLDTNFTSGGSFVSSISSQNDPYNPGQTYYVLLSIRSQTPGLFNGQNVLVSAVAPGSINTTNSGGGTGNNNTGGSGTNTTNSGGGTPMPTPPNTLDPGIGQINFTSSINNPLGQDFDIIEFFQKLFANLVKIAIPILVLFMVYSGFKFVEAQGNEEKLKKAKQNFLYVIIGAFLILGAWTIATALRGTVEQLEQPIVFISQFINLI